MRFKKYKDNMEKMNMFVEMGNDLFLIGRENINDPKLYKSIKWVIN